MTNRKNRLVDIVSEIKLFCVIMSILRTETWVTLASAHLLHNSIHSKLSLTVEDTLT